MKSQSIPIEILREIFSYDPTSGALIWQKKVASKVVVGTAAGCMRPDGYLCVRCFGCLMLVHRVVWAMHHGYWPPIEVDHINGIKSDNRIENLRKTTIKQNRQNSKLRWDNSTGEKGITFYPDRGTYLVRIQNRYIGRFRSKEDAVDARLREEEKSYGEFSYHRRPAGA